MSTMNKTFRVFGINGEILGTVGAKTKKGAPNAAVARGLVTGRKQIGSIQELVYDDPYEQTFDDIFGSNKNMPSDSF
jgi:hypothetical protein